MHEFLQHMSFCNDTGIGTGSLMRIYLYLQRKILVGDICLKVFKRSSKILVVLITARSTL
jgi:hypothetical protein